MRHDENPRAFFVDGKIAVHRMERDLRVIAERFRFTLMTMLHSRIAYPRAESKFQTPKEEGFRPDVMAATKKPPSAPPVSAA